MFRTLFALVLVVPFISCATTTSQPKLDDVLLNAERILHVKILSSSVELFRFDGKEVSCGISYRSEVVGERSAERSELVFASRSSLAANGEYVIAVGIRSNELPRGAQWLEQPSYLDSDAYEACKGKLPSVWAENIYKFSEYGRGQDGSPKWLIRDGGSPVPAEGVQTIKLHCKSDDVTGCERIGEPVLISWESLKKYIQKTRP